MLPTGAGARLASGAGIALQQGYVSRIYQMEHRGVLTRSPIVGIIPSGFDAEDPGILEKP